MTEPTQNFWEIAYKQNIGKMLGVCYRYVRDKQLAEDLAHDAFLNAIDKSAGFRGEGHFDAWLRKIAVNVALQYLREQKKKEYHNEWIQYENENMESNEEALTTDFSEEELLDAINQLPEHHKMVFNLFVIDKFGHAEIAQELGINENTSKSHLARARKKIRSILLAKKEKERTVFAFFLPIKIWNIDKTYQKAFCNFELEPTNFLKTDAYDSNSWPIPKFNPYPVVSKSFIGSGVVLGGVAVSLFVVVVSSQQEPKNGLEKELTMQVSLADDKKAIETKADKQDSIITFQNKNTTPINISQNSDSTSATIVDNAIIPDENNLNNTDMKRLNTVSALLLAGATSMGFDSSANPRFKLGSDLKLPDIHFQEPKIQEPQDEFVVKRKEGEGIFNASKISWSSKNHQVYMKGIAMKAKFGKDKFNATGTVSFLGEVYYLVIDGEEVPMDKDIKLSEGNYSVKALSINQSVRKYGEKGKNGAVEIVKL
ncbi:RNA polymerase sigma factor [Emticicia agri]|uniref:Sigma-70 family RNA polymerase sigma factor n=1 Tax=Emticicia agri TaxID=2492393 RepID=A0A4Q5LSS2_9BACT|nr:sigma-70 family RNA polymerase sigma factor [Emticicia agri]RYU92648.1 sigma-70 family RNA polymerase sigma factor [Emticicia agri]